MRGYMKHKTYEYYIVRTRKKIVSIFADSYQRKQYYSITSRIAEPSQHEYQIVLNFMSQKSESTFANKQECRSLKYIELVVENY